MCVKFNLSYIYKYIRITPCQEVQCICDECTSHFLLQTLFDKQVLHKTSLSVSLPSKTVEKENEEKTDRMLVL